MNDRPLVYIALHLPDDARARIESACRIREYAGTGLVPKPELIAALAGADGLIGSTQLSVDAETIASSPRLRVISNVGVGFDNVDVAAATARRVVVCNTPGVLTDAVADLTLGLIVSLARRLPESERFVREGRWGSSRTLALGSDLAGKTLGVVGLGRIGRAVASRARAFGMDVCFHDRFREPPADTAFCSFRDLDGLLREADVLSLHVELREETRGLIGARELALMKPSAYLVNTSRGHVVDQAALVAALREERLAGAALDVFEREPLPPDDPLLSLPNVIALPHVGSATVETRRAMRELAIDNLLAVLSGDEPPCAVNPEAMRAGRA